MGCPIRPDASSPRRSLTMPATNLRTRNGCSKRMTSTGASRSARTGITIRGAVACHLTSNDNGRDDMELTEAVAAKVLQVVDAGLCVGKGKPVLGQMCVEAAVCFALGEPHSDEPSCVGSAVRAFKIRLNDSPWSSDQARAKGMRR